jgi:hypothetical protein
MTKLLGSLCVAGMLVAGVVGCSGGTTTPPKAEKVVTEAKEALKKAEDALKENKVEANKKDLEKAVDEARDKVKKAEEELKKAKG